MAGPIIGCPFEEDGFPAAYALEILDGDEHVAFEAHLATCAVCPGEVIAYLAASSDIPIAYGDALEMSPAPELRARVLAAVAERDVASANHNGPVPAPRGTLPISAVARRRSWHRIPLAAAAALMLLIGVGLLLRALVPSTVTPTASTSPATFALGSAGGATGQATYLAGERLLRLSFRDLPPLAPGQVYQLWLLRDDRLESARVFSLSGGTGTTTVPLDPAPYRALYVTIEPAPDGSSRPTTAPAIAAAFGGAAVAPAGPVPTLACTVGTNPTCVAATAPRGISPTAVATLSGASPTIAVPLEVSTPTRVTVPTGTPTTAGASPTPQGSATTDPTWVPAPPAPTRVPSESATPGIIPTATNRASTPAPPPVPLPSPSSNPTPSATPTFPAASPSSDPTSVPTPGAPPPLPPRPTPRPSPSPTAVSIPVQPETSPTPTAGLATSVPAPAPSPAPSSGPTRVPTVPAMLPLTPEPPPGPPGPPGRRSLNGSESLAAKT